MMTHDQTERLIKAVEVFVTAFATIVEKYVDKEEDNAD